MLCRPVQRYPFPLSCSSTHRRAATSKSDLHSYLQTDSTRAKDLELHIQSRVAAELSRLEAEHTRALRELEEKISNSPDASTASSHASSTTTPDQSESVGGVDHKAKKAGDKKRDLGRDSVMKEIETLRRTLGERKIREEVDADRGVKRAKEEVVQCLRVNDRRPLDCWREVEAFKREVGRLEKGFVERVVG